MPPLTPCQRLIVLSLALAGAACPAKITPDQLEFFESRIRPVLAQECYECHSTAKKKKGGLLLDSRGGWMAGGDSGAAIVPGKPEESLLLASIRHEDPDLKMPDKGAKLEPGVIADFENWIALGAPDPRDHPPTNEDLAQDTNWRAVLERRKAWWSFQPISNPAVPNTSDPEWSSHPVDRFLRLSMNAKGLEPALDADPRLRFRRLNYVLIGLPPSPDEIAKFITAYERDPKQAWEDAVERALSSPRFGEKWGRHFMDWMRYAETHGSEGDPQIPYAWQYRDYLIRALNVDVPLRQIIREHVAGDLLSEPRINADAGINESAIGAAHYRMVLERRHDLPRDFD